MTPQRKINILNKVIKRFEEIIPKFDKDKMAYMELGGFGICNYLYFKVLRPNAIYFKEKGYWDANTFAQEEFNIKMPRDNLNYKWALTKQGYQARVRACKKAVEYWKKQIEKGKKK